MLNISKTFKNVFVFCSNENRTHLADTRPGNYTQKCVISDALDGNDN